MQQTTGVRATICLIFLHFVDVFVMNDVDVAANVTSANKQWADRLEDELIRSYAATCPAGYNAVRNALAESAQY